MASSNRFFMKQAMMRKVLIGTIPITLGAIYFFGLRTIPLMLVSIGAAVFTEYLFNRKEGKPVSEASIVSAVLFTLTLPVSTPYWVAVVGMVFGVLFAKEVFGGYGRNVFNPALAGRTFLYVSFPGFLTNKWNLPAEGFPGGFGQFMTPSIDTVTGSTPLSQISGSGAPGIAELFFGNISGSLGETSIALLLISTIYLLATKTIDWKLLVSPLLGFILFNSIFYYSGVEGVSSPELGFLSGSIFFLAVFFVTEPITAPKTKEAKWIYGFLIGMIVMIIRAFGIFVAGGMFAVLIMNAFAPILDEAVKEVKKYGKNKAIEKGGNQA